MINEKSRGWRTDILERSELETLALDGLFKMYHVLNTFTRKALVQMHDKCRRTGFGYLQDKARLVQNIILPYYQTEYQMRYCDYGKKYFFETEDSNSDSYPPDSDSDSDGESDIEDDRDCNYLIMAHESHPITEERYYPTKRLINIMLNQ